MNIWIITTGSSDVQVNTQDNWERLRGNVRSQLETGKQFSESKFPNRKQWLYPARAVGVVYGPAIEKEPKSYYDLVFPLLDNFFWILEGKDDEVEKVSIDRVIVLVTDQSNNFTPKEKNDPFSAFWQDTCTLKTILKEYFKLKSIENPEFLIIDPDPNKSSGLDNWNDVLERVQQKFNEKFVDLKNISEDITVYVSHQAGTPALSSAVQFCSLAKFGDRVRFLVSNEYDRKLTGFVESSSYLRGIEIQQAKKLLENYDYSGMKEVLKKQIEKADKPKEKPKLEDEILKHISYLLDAAIQWNFAKFEDFAKKLSSYSEQNLVNQKQAYLQDVELAQTYLENAERAKAYLQNPDQYWWTAYEAAYLGVARLNQGDTVEAMFHSFRAIEGLLSLWFEKYEKALRDAGQPELMRNRRNQIELPREITALNKRGDSQIYSTANSYGQGLYFIIASIKNISQEIAKDIWVFGNFVVHCRNDLFHKIEGLKDQDSVFKQWKYPDEEEFIFKQWQTRVLNCLNFIAQDDLPQPFSSLEQASLMAQVHQELVKAIVSL